MTSIAELGSLNALEYLHVQWNSLLNPSLAEFPNLRGVNLDGNDINELDGVAQTATKTLEWINLNETGVRDLSGLSGFHSSEGYLLREIICEF